MRLFTIAICIFVFVFSPLILQGQEIKTITFVTGEYPPYVSEKLPDYGIFSKKLKFILEKNNIKADFKFYPWARCEELIRTGLYPATFPYVTSEKRKTLFDFSRPLLSTTVKFFYYGTNPVKGGIFKDLIELKGIKIGVIKGYYYEDQFKELGLNMIYHYNEQDSLNALKNKRIQLFPIDEAVGFHLVGLYFNKDMNFQSVNRSILTKGMRVMLSKKHPQANDLRIIINSEL